MAELNDLLATRGLSTIASDFTNLISEPNLKLGAQAWTSGSSAGATPVFDATGVYWIVDDTNDILRILRPFGATIQPGTYVFYLDVSIEQISSSNDVAFVQFNPFINGTGFTFPTKNIKLGANQKIALAFTTAIAGDNFGVYFSFGTYGGFRTELDQLAVTPNIKLTIHTAQLVKLDAYGQSLLTSQGETKFGSTIDGLGAPYFPNPAPIAGNAKYAIRASAAAVADTALVADTATRITSGFSGKTIRPVGDSIAVDLSYQDDLASILGATVTPVGQGGITVGQHGGIANHGLYRKSWAEGTPLDTAAIIFLAGANDVILGYRWNNEAGGLPIGNVNDAYLTDAQLTSGTQPASFSQAYWTMLANFRRKFRRTPFFICTQMQYFGRYNSATPTVFMQTPGADIKADMIRQIAAKAGIPLIDLFNESQITLWTSGDYLLTEDAGNLRVHPTQAGGKRIAEVMAGRLRDISPLNYVNVDFGPTDLLA